MLSARPRARAVRLVRVARCPAAGSAILDHGPTEARCRIFRQPHLERITDARGECRPVQALIDDHDMASSDPPNSANAPNVPNSAKLKQPLDIRRHPVRQGLRMRALILGAIQHGLVGQAADREAFAELLGHAGAGLEER